MSRTMGALCLIAVSYFSLALADKFLAAGISSHEVQRQLHSQLKTLLGQGDADSTDRLERLQAQLNPLFAAMPKDADGGVDQGTARYALHRFFSQQHGWHVRGLEVSGNEKWSDAASTTMLEDHIPSYVLQLFQQQRGGRTGLRELAVLAATLEDVVHSETIQLLSTVFAAQSLPVGERIYGEAVHRVITTYLLFHTLPSPHYAELTTEELNELLEQAHTFWTAWVDMVMWVEDLGDAMDFDESSRENPFVEKVAISHDFASLVRLVEGVGENYGQFQNLECLEMKNSLLDLSDGSGRVRLAKFYQAAVENQTTHFSESPDYLRHLGALDETDPRQPSVIMTNYIYARANCVASSGLYSICCIDQCETLMARLERSIAHPLADPEMVAGLVATIPSDTVSAPRNISTPMRRRLDDIAARHGGWIPIHGRLFAQWMHHAFPNECAYPHLTGSLAAPLTPTEWFLAEEETGLRLKASQEEMEAFVQAHAALQASDPRAAAEEPLLPWTEEEELRVGGAHPLGKASSWLRLAALALAIFSAAFRLIKMLCSDSGSTPPAKPEKDSRWLSSVGGAQKSDLHLV